MGTIARSYNVDKMRDIKVHYNLIFTHMRQKLTIIDSDNGLSPDRHQAIIWTNSGLLLIGPLRINFSEILIEILTFSFKKMHLKVSSAKLCPFCLGLNGLNKQSSLWWFETPWRSCDVTAMRWTEQCLHDGFKGFYSRKYNQLHTSRIGDLFR